MAVADASFNTSIDSISLGFKNARAFSVCFSSPPKDSGVVPLLLLLNGTPSITYKGSVPPKNELEPRILILRPAPGAPSFCVTFTPASLPCMACKILPGLSRIMSSLFSLCAEPVKSDFFTVPYPITTTSASAEAVDFNETVTVVLLATFTSDVSIPTKVTTSIFEAAGRSIEKLPLSLVNATTFVFFTVMVAPLIGTPTSSNTLPVIFFV